MKKFIILFTAIFAINSASAQFCSARINALKALTGTLDVGMDVALTDNLTLDLAAQYNPINLNSFSLAHYGAEVGAKYWIFENFVGHYMGAHLGYDAYDIGDKKRRFDGNAYRWGISYGYAWILTVKWNVAVEAGLGLCYTKDREYDPKTDDWAVEYIYHHRRITMIPTRIGATFNYLF